MYHSSVCMVSLETGQPSACYRLTVLLIGMLKAQATATNWAMCVSLCVCVHVCVIMYE